MKCFERLLKNFIRLGLTKPLKKLQGKVSLKSTLQNGGITLHLLCTITFLAIQFFSALKQYTKSLFPIEKSKNDVIRDSKM